MLPKDRNCAPTAAGPPFAGRREGGEGALSSAKHAAGRLAPSLVIALAATYLAGMSAWLLASFVLFPLWLQVNPAGVIARAMLGTPFAHMAPWLRFGSIYVPEVLCLGCAAALVGLSFPTCWIRFVLAVATGFACTGAAFGASLAGGAQWLWAQGDRAKAVTACMLSLMPYLLAPLCALAGACWHRKRRPLAGARSPDCAPIPLRAVLTNWGFGVRVALAILLPMVGIALQPRVVQALVRSSVAASLSVTGGRVETNDEFDDPEIALDGHWLRIAPGCTALGTFLWLAPLVWSRSRTTPSNARSLMLLAALVALINLMRLVVAIYLYAGGWPYEWVEGFPNSVLFTFPFVVLLLARACQVAPREPTTEVESPMGDRTAQ